MPGDRWIRAIPPAWSGARDAERIGHRLTIKNIVCHDRNDEQFHELYDEVYINVTGQRVWGTTSVTDLGGNPYTVNAPIDLVGAPGAFLARSRCGTTTTRAPTIAWPS